LNLKAPNLHLQRRRQVCLVAVSSVKSENSACAIRVHGDVLVVVKVVFKIVRSATLNLDYMLVFVRQVALDRDSLVRTLGVVPASIWVPKVTEERSLASVLKSNGHNLFRFDGACFGPKGATTQPASVDNVAGWGAWRGVVPVTVIATIRTWASSAVVDTRWRCNRATVEHN